MEHTDVHSAKHSDMEHSDVPMVTCANDVPDGYECVGYDEETAGVKWRHRESGKLMIQKQAEDEQAQEQIVEEDKLYKANVENRRKLYKALQEQWGQECIIQRETLLNQKQEKQERAIRQREGRKKRQHANDVLQTPVLPNSPMAQQDLCVKPDLAIVSDIFLSK